MIYDLISIGDPTIDTFIKVHDAHLSCKINHSDCQICFDYSNKIAVDDFFKFPAGNMPNNAVGAARLGLKVAAYGVVGSDADGEWIKEIMGNEGVETKFIRSDKTQPTNSSSVIVFQKERTIFVGHKVRDYQLPILPPAEWVYATSIGPLSPHLQKIERELLGYLKTHTAKLAFNPGTYQLLTGASGLKPMLERTEIIFLNKEETQGLTGKHSNDFKVLLHSLCALGPKVAVITDGPNGSYCYDGSHYWACGIYDTPVVERTGAGDSFATGFVSARFYGMSIPEAMRWGTFNSAYVVGKYGGILGLQTKDQIEKLSANHPELKVKEF